LSQRTCCDEEHRDRSDRLGGGFLQRSAAHVVALTDGRRPSSSASWRR
jgi:hypothetical protein